MLRLMSNNVWNYDNNNTVWEQKGMDCSAPVRAPILVDIYADLAPDVIGTQEMTNLMTRELTAGLRARGFNYAVLWGNFTSIFYRADKLEVLTAAYEPYPEEYEGYEGKFNDVLSKSLNTALFRVKETGKTFLFATTHLWWQSSVPGNPYYQYGSDEVRTIQMDIATRKLIALQEQYGCPVVLLGDMNTGYNTPAIQLALQKGFRHGHDVAAEYACQENGHHHCGPDGYVPYVPQPFEEAIDHILVRGFADGAVRRFDRTTPEKMLPVTDHSPVWVDVEL